MHVVRHDDIAANCDVEIDSALRKLNESIMCSFGGEDRSAAMRAKGNEINWRVASLKDFIEARRTPAKSSGEHKFTVVRNFGNLQSTIQTAHSAVATRIECARFLSRS